MFKEWFFNQKTNTIIVLALVFTLFFTIIFNAFLLFNLQHKEHQEKLQEDHEKITALLAASLQFPLWSNARHSAENILQTLFQDERIVSVTVWEKTKQQPVLHILQPERIKGAVSTKTAPILFGHSRVGEVEVRLSSAAMDRELKALFWTNISYFLLQFSLSLFLLLGILYLKITKPLGKLLSFAHAIGEYPLGTKPPWRHNDEISKIGRAFEEAKHTISTISMRDPQTGIHNHYMLTKLLQNLFNQCRQHKNPLGIILIEITNFKQINEHYGHLKGDALLLGLTQDIARLKKQHYHFGRWGGSTLLLLCPNEECQSLETLANALNHHIERTLYADKISASCAFGVAQCNPNEESAEQGVKRASLAVSKARVSQYSAIVTEA